MLQFKKTKKQKQGWDELAVCLCQHATCTVVRIFSSSVSVFSVYVFPDIKPGTSDLKKTTCHNFKAHVTIVGTLSLVSCTFIYICTQTRPRLQKARWAANASSVTIHPRVLKGRPSLCWRAPCFALIRQVRIKPQTTNAYAQARARAQTRWFSLLLR